MLAALSKSARNALQISLCMYEAVHIHRKDTILDIFFTWKAGHLSYVSRRERIAFLSFLLRNLPCNSLIEVRQQVIEIGLTD